MRLKSYLVDNLHTRILYERNWAVIITVIFNLFIEEVRS
jgi:cell shape-determining protein MreD